MKHTGFYGLSDARSALPKHKLVEVRGGRGQRKGGDSERRRIVLQLG